MAKRRPYDNSARSAQAAETRARILDAAIELIGRPNGDLVIAELAERAEVSVPTVYKHFPNRDAILWAVRVRVDETSARPPRARSIAELRRSIPELHRFFAAREGLIRAINTSPGLATLREETFRARDENFARILAKFTQHLSAEEASGVRALLFRLTAAPAWLELKDEHHLSDPVITRMTLWAANALLDRLVADARHAGSDADEETPIPPPAAAKSRPRGR